MTKLDFLHIWLIFSLSNFLSYCNWTFMLGLENLNFFFFFFFFFFPPNAFILSELPIYNQKKYNKNAKTWCYPPPTWGTDSLLFLLSNHPFPHRLKCVVFDIYFQIILLFGFHMNIVAWHYVHVLGHLWFGFSQCFNFCNSILHTRTFFFLFFFFFFFFSPPLLSSFVFSW